MYSKDDVKVVEGYWKNYQLYKREVALCEKALSKSELKNDRRYQRMKELIAAIDLVYKNLSEQFQKFIQIRYWNKYSSTLEYAEVADELGVSLPKVFKIRVFVMKETAETMGYIAEPLNI